jgi:hypothetical protein
MSDEKRLGPDRARYGFPRSRRLRVRRTSTSAPIQPTATIPTQEKSRPDLLGGASEEIRGPPRRTARSPL